MEVMQAIKERRSIRKYRPVPISDEAINTVLEAARWAPSWRNSQCWRFIVVRDPGLKEKLAGTLKPESNRGIAAIKDAPVAIVACAHLGESGYYRDEIATDKGDWFMFDVALAMQNLMLAAHAIGLGTVHIGLFDAGEAARLLDVPDGFVVVEMTPLGYPDEQPAVPKRRELAESIFHEKYGSK